MLGKVVLVNFYEFSLNLGNRCRILMVDPRGHTFRHPADDQIVAVGFQQAVVEDFFNGLIFLDAFIVSKEGRVGCFQKLVEAERIQIEQIDHAHGIGLWLREKGAKQTSGCNNMVLVGFLFEVFEGVERLRAFLYLIKNDESFPRQNFFPGDHGKQFNDPLGVFVCLENGFQLIFLVKVIINIAFIAALAELFHEPGLSYLTGAADNERFSLRVVFPFYKLRKCISFHVHHRLLLWMKVA